MSRLTDIVRRSAKRPQRKGPPPSPAAKPAATPPVPEKPSQKELVAQRDRLLEKFTVMQADLGGAFYEMAIRDHVRLDVLTRKAAELQRVDAELLRSSGCSTRALRRRRPLPQLRLALRPRVRFCAQCGTALAAPVEAAPAAAAAPTPTPAPATPPAEAPTQEVPRTPKAESAS